MRKYLNHWSNNQLNINLKLLFCGILFAIVIVSFLGIYGCKKVQNNSQLTISELNSKTEKFMAKNGFKSILSKIDFSTTKQVQNENSFQLFHTKLSANRHFARALISIVRPDQKIFQFVVEVDKIAENETRSKLYALNGTQFAFYHIKDGLVDYEQQMVKKLNDDTPISTILIDDDGEIHTDLTPPSNFILEATQSWWSCTKGCVKDCKIACAMDQECATLLMISNLPTGQGLAGLGTASLWFSCGSACAYKPDMDLLPEY